MIPLAILASIACHHVSIRGCEVYGRFAGREPLINPLVLGFVNGWRICFGLFFGGAFFFFGLWGVGWVGCTGVRGLRGLRGAREAWGRGERGLFFGYAPLWQTDRTLQPEPGPRFGVLGFRGFGFKGIRYKV